MQITDDDGDDKMIDIFLFLSYIKMFTSSDDTVSFITSSVYHITTASLARAVCPKQHEPMAPLLHCDATKCVTKRTGYQETTLTPEAQECKSSSPRRVTLVDDRFTSLKVVQQGFFLARRITLALHQFGKDVCSSSASSKK
jgi:hypothetical protein